jgi:hypothetical protein
MSYVPPHARSSVKANSNVKPNVKPNTKPALKNNYVNEFPELGVVKPTTVNQMNFKKLFDDELYEITEKPKEIQKGLVILTKNGVINSLTVEEQEQEQTSINNKLMHKNMIDMYIRIEQQRKNRLLQDSEYIPEEVIPEYSSSEGSISTIDSETDAEDPEDDNEF